MSLPTTFNSLILQREIDSVEADPVGKGQRISLASAVSMRTLSRSDSPNTAANLTSSKHELYRF